MNIENNEMFLEKFLSFDNEKRLQDNWPGGFRLGLCNADTHLVQPVSTLEDRSGNCLSFLTG